MRQARPRLNPLSSLCMALLLSQWHLAKLPVQEKGASLSFPFLPVIHSSSAWAGSSSADPSAVALLDTPLRDLEDRAVVLKSLLAGPSDDTTEPGPVLVILHQDRKSGQQNQDFKDQLGRLTALPSGRARLRIIALADVASYDFWPAKGYVKDALRPLQAGGGALVLCDWKGLVRKRYAIPPGQSAIFVIAPSGQLRAFRQGLLGSSDTQELLQFIKGMLGGPAGGR